MSELPEQDKFVADVTPAKGVDVPAAVVAGRKSGFAGFSWGQLLGGAALLGAVVWGAWATREIVALGEKRIVAVSLAAMANDFVMAEARSGNSPEQTDADTRHYMQTLQAVLKARGDGGETILVGEAVVGSSVPDITPDVREAVGKLITANPPPRVAGAAVAPPAAGVGAAPGAGLPAGQGFPGGQGGAMMPSGPAGAGGAPVTSDGVSNGVGGN